MLWCTLNSDCITKGHLVLDGTLCDYNKVFLLLANVKNTSSRPLGGPFQPVC